MDNLTALAARDDLLAIVAAWPALQARLEPNGAPNGGGPRPAPSSRPPINIDVSDLIHEITGAAIFYGQVLIEEVRPTHGCGGTCHGAPDHTSCSHPDGEPSVSAHDCPQRKDPVSTSEMPALLHDVALRFGHFTHGDDEKAGYDFTDTAHELRRKVTLTLERPEPPRWMGPCVVDECDGELKLHGHRIDTRCPVCGHVAGLAEIRAHLYDALKDRLMTASEITSALHVLGHDVPHETVKTWAKRAKLEAIVVDPTLYRLEDAIALAEARVSRLQKAG
ncbi:hypothetical protein ACWHA6_36345 [Streptomyces anthocyanicus]